MPFGTAPFSTALASQRAEIIRHLAELPDDLGVAEISGRGVASAADNASARITTATGLKHSVGSPAAMPSSLATNGSAT